MTDTGHSARAHSKLGPSGASRWMACPGSVRLEGMFPERTSSEPAEEGTAAHELAEILLQQLVGQFEPEKLARFEAENRFYSKGMRDYVDDYVRVVEEKMNEAYARTAQPTILFEQRLDYSPWVPEGYGTGDVVIVADGCIDVVDLKYGKGVPVSAENNPQGRLYGLGALNEYGFLYEINCVRVTIVQPRLDNITTEEISVKDLLKWADDVIRPAAEATQQPTAPTIAGTHCRFCSAREHCKARGEWAMQVGKYDQRDPALLSLEEIADVLGKVDNLVKWANDVKEFALKQAEKHGKSFPGWKLVEGRSNRILTDKLGVAATLELEGFESQDIYKPQELKGLTELEDSIGKKLFKSLLSNYVVKPTGKPALVPAMDPRPGISSLASIESDFSEEMGS